MDILKFCDRSSQKRKVTPTGPAPVYFISKHQLAWKMFRFQIVFTSQLTVSSAGALGETVIAAEVDRFWLVRN